MRWLVALVVAEPIVLSVVPLVLARYRERLGWSVAAVGLAAHAVATVTLAGIVLRTGALSYVVGGAPAPFAVELVVDGLSIAFLLLHSGLALLVLAYTRRGGPRSDPFYSLYLLLVAGLSGVCVAADVFTLYVFLEVGGLAAYALVARAASGRAALASLRYLLLGTVGASLYLLGVGYLYAAVGTLNMTDVAATLPHESTLSVAAFALVFVGLGTKMALFPLHTWQPDAYETAPPAVSVLLSALVSTTAAYALVRLTYGVFTVAFLRANPIVEDAILAVAVASVVAGGVLALRQSGFDRLLAYSSVSQFGIATVGIGLGTAAGVTGAVVHLLGHAVTKAGLFAAGGVVAARTDATGVEEYAGLADRLPTESAALAALGLGMVGVPPTVGFVGKWYVAVAAAEAGRWGGFSVVLLSTLLSLAYFGRLLERMYVRPPPADAMDGPVDATDNSSVASLGMTSVVVGCALLSIAMGLGAVALARMLDAALGGVVP